MNSTTHNSEPSVGRLHLGAGCSLFALAMILGCVLMGRPASAETLIINPTCGPTGTSVSMTGSGWAEPNPPCFYDFLFDGASFAPNQPDGLFGPPNATGTVPMAATKGKHTIKVELRDSADMHLEGCRQDTFTVVDSTMDPFNMGMNVKLNDPAAVMKYGGSGFITIDFDPTNVCDVTKCTKIVAIQMIQTVGTKADNSTRNLNFTERGIPRNNNDITGAGWAVDTSGASPYYQAGGAGHNGNQSDMPMISELIDRPRQSAASFPADITKITKNFETDYFCAEGENRGEFLGMVTWTWEKTLASAQGAGGTSDGVVTLHSNGNRNQPTTAFNDAVNLFDTNHMFLFPTIAPKQLPPGQGGQSCD